MKVWVTCFVLGFAAIEFYQWFEGLSLPMPVFVGMGALLAIASNADKIPGLALKSSPVQPPLPTPQPPTPNAQPLSTPQLPNLNHQPEKRSISFVIRKPGQQ